MLSERDIEKAEGLLTLEALELCDLELWDNQDLGMQMRHYDFEHGGNSARNYAHKINFLLILLENQDALTP